MPEDTKNKWEKFVDENEFTTISMLIRKAVNFYIDSNKKISYIENFSKLSHDLKEPLTTIKGFAQLIIENDSEKLDTGLLLKMKEIYTQSIFLEKKINEILLGVEPRDSEYDILIVEDNNSTIMLLADFFERKGYSYSAVTTGTKALEELSRSTPKLIILDIILPDISGYEVCTKIKSDKKLKNIPVFYATAVTEFEVRGRLEETGADGYFLKPFDFNKFDILFDYL